MPCCPVPLPEQVQKEEMWTLLCWWEQPASRLCRCGRRGPSTSATPACHSSNPRGAGLAVRGQEAACPGHLKEKGEQPDVGGKARVQALRGPR